MPRKQRKFEDKSDPERRRAKKALLMDVKVDGVPGIANIWEFPDIAKGESLVLIVCADGELTAYIESQEGAEA